MLLDNPSYFSIAVDKQSFDCGIRRPKMGNADSNLTGSSDCSRQPSPPPPPPPPRGHGKKPLRTFLRSVSSNSADSNQELLIMGEPRLSDIAPDLAFKHPAGRSNSLKTKAEMKHEMYAQLPASEEAAAELSGDEVFIEEDSARYCNYLAAARGAPRRHSIGTFSRERSRSITASSKNFREDFPQGIIHATSDGDSVGLSSALTIDDHSLRHASYPRKRCSRCTRGTALKSVDMDDILIVSLKGSEASSLWVDYFTSYFKQISKQANRKPFKIQYWWVEDGAGDEQKISEEKAAVVKLQLVVVCPGLLDFITEHPEHCCGLGRALLADRTLALLLGVADGDVTEAHKAVLPTYTQWQRLGVGQDQDENFTKEFLGQAMAILSRVWKQQSSVSNQEKSAFSVSPKKIRQGQNSVFILLTYPLQKEDILKISIERHNEIFEIKTVKRRNPYTVKISVPDNLTEVTAIVNILVEKNGNIVGSRPIKCESKLRELEQVLRLTNNPVEFMCQTLGFSPANKDQLDNWLLQGFQRNLPSQFHLLSNHATPFAAAIHAHKHSHEEYPTLLHFAAKFGFEKLAMQLLDCPGADVAYDVRNVYDMTPSEIAEANGHSELASTLRGYMNMNEFTNVYARLKEISLNSSKMSTVDEESYLVPKSLEEFYKICPAPRPVRAENNMNSPDVAVTTPASDCSTPGYMTMNTSVKLVKDEMPEANNSLKKNSHVMKSKNDLNDARSPQHHPKPSDIPEDKVQKELAEIFIDFKNHVHSLSQVEKLVEEWNNRNDVQKSFREKQDQLREMRLKYETIQQEMKAAMKKSTPFERVRKLFGRGKSREDKHEISSPILAAQGVTGPQAQRPISSLSTSSSSSSGRMSTISASSLGDSGTHSDNEERKNILGNHSEDYFRNELNKAVLEFNYTPVPAPKPVKSGMFTNRNQSFETIQEKPIQRPDTLPINEEFYIQFPPSGLPIPGVLDKKVGDQEYVNINTNTNDNINESHEYMNFKVMTNR